MSQRDRLPLHFGEGLDRATGPLSVSPARQADQRNVLLFDGIARVRPGSLVASSMPASPDGAITDLIKVFPYRAGGRLLVLGARIVGSKWNVYLYQTDLTGGNPAYVGKVWDQLAPSARPVVSCAESYRKVFFAHVYHPYDAGGVPLRGVTRVYEGTIAVPTLTDYPALDLDGTGAESPRFAGVVSYLNYLVGWGYGSKSQADRPDIVRISKPGAPTELGKNDYIVCGQPAQPVMCCRPAGDVLAVLKEIEAFDIFGFDARTFGIRQSDQVYGCIGPQLAISVGGGVYSWTHQGPRVFGGGPSVDISIPLGFINPPPLDLPAPGEVVYAHTVYDADTRRVIWYWPNKDGTTVAVCLNLWNPERPAWSFDVYGSPILSACALNLTIIPPPVGAPSITGVTPGELSADSDVANIGNIGDETLEVWRRTLPGGAWTAVDAVPATAGAPQTVRLDGLATSTDYEVAVRYEKGGQYSVGALSSNPSDWPATQRATFTTDGASPPAAALDIAAKCYDSHISGYGVVFTDVLGGLPGAELAVAYMGQASTPTLMAPPAASPPPGAVIYVTNPGSPPCARSTSWHTGGPGYSVYYAWVRQTDPSVGPWSAGYRFWAGVNISGLGSQFFDDDGLAASGSTMACPLAGGGPVRAMAMRATPRDARPAFAAAPARLFYAMGASADLRRQDFEAITDAGNVFRARLETNRYAPAGAGGEAVYQALYLAVATNAAAEIRITPIIEERELAVIVLGIMPDGTGAVRTQRHLLLLTEVFSNGGQPKFKYRPRGAWFQARLEVQQFSSGVVSVDGFDLEHELVRDSVAAEGT